MLVSTEEQEIIHREQQVMTHSLHTQDNHGRIFLVVLVQVENLMVVVHK
tara:strand:- start:338 stop:484 length:147 start_codon:yes stop_codon:yes gene_type:complete